MLISFTFENWKSFRDEARFSMVAGRGLQKAERLPVATNFGIELLPVSVVYGGNAAGKSNFFEALDFARSFVVEGSKLDEPISVTPFRLDAKSERLPSKFSFRILSNERIFKFSFTVNRQEVIEEQLTEITKSSEIDLYIRSKGDTFSIKHSTTDGMYDEQFVEFVKRATSKNQLFLTKSIALNFDEYRPVFDWFKNNLKLVHSSSNVIMPQGSVEMHMFQESAMDIITQLDTGIDKISFEKAELRYLDFPDQVISRLEQNLQEKNSKALITVQGGDRVKYYHVTREKDKLVCYRWVTHHKRQDGGEIKFEIDRESAGTVRLFELLPVLSDMFSRDSRNVYVIDEIDRSLHTLLTRELIQNFLFMCEEGTRCQLVFTTHDLMLMNQHIFRRDEIWLTERKKDGSSSIFSMYDFQKTNSEKDVRKAYLTGRFGAIPKLDLNIYNSRDGDTFHE